MRDGFRNVMIIYSQMEFVRIKMRASKAYLFHWKNKGDMEAALGGKKKLRHNDVSFWQAVPFVNR